MNTQPTKTALEPDYEFLERQRQARIEAQEKAKAAEGAQVLPEDPELVALQAQLDIFEEDQGWTRMRDRGSGSSTIIRKDPFSIRLFG